MADSVAAHVEFIEGEDVFGKIVRNGIVNTEFPANCFL